MFEPFTYVFHLLAKFFAKHGWKAMLWLTLAIVSVALIVCVDDSAYKRGVRDTEAEYAKSTERISRSLADNMNSIFKQYDEKLSKLQEDNHGEIAKIVNQYAGLHDCHSPDGISLLNSKINSRSDAAHTGATGKH